jgi:predicted RNA-binding Zn-ribbon protein involved in translation (DUF1610 family)
MSRYRLSPSPAQEAALRDHCGHARYVWNLAVEQHAHWHPGRTSAPGYLEQCLLVRRPRDKAPGRVEKINAAFTSQRCSACGQVDPKSRESQAVFRCTACGYARNADVNAARNIAAGHPTHLPIPLHLRGGCRDTGPVNREPQLLSSLAGRQ